jgi:hypothetical protein
VLDGHVPDAAISVISVVSLHSGRAPRRSSVALRSPATMTSSTRPLHCSAIQCGAPRSDAPLQRRQVVCFTDSRTLSIFARYPRCGPRGQGVRIRGESTHAPRPRHHCRHPGEERPDRVSQTQGQQGWPTARLRRRGLQRPQRRRAIIRARQAMARNRDPLRQAGHHLPSRSRPPRRPHLWAALLGDTP